MGPVYAFLSFGSVTYFLHAFISLFVIINAIGNVPLFVPLLARFQDAEKRVMMKKATIIAALSLLVVSATGNLLFRLLGIEMYSFRIAGGILLIIISIEMLLGQKTRTQSSRAEEEVSSEMDDITVIPLAIPLLTGPGALTTGIVLFDSAGDIINRVILMGTIVLVFCDLLHDSCKFEAHLKVFWKNRHAGGKENYGPYAHVHSSSVHYTGCF